MEQNKTPWEDHLLERKTDRQLKDIRRTAVAFANSVRPGHTAIILIGECDDGSVPGVIDADKMQREMRTELDKIYPPIVWRQRPYEKGGKTCIQIEIEYSGETPHFGDAAWIRRNNESVKASQVMLDKLIAMRSSKVRVLTEWLGKKVTLSWSAGEHAVMGPNWSKVDCNLLDVTEFYATFERIDNGKKRSEPISWLEISWDDLNSRLRVFVNAATSRLD